MLGLRIFVRKIKKPKMKIQKAGQFRLARDCGGGGDEEKLQIKKLRNENCGLVKACKGWWWRW